MVKQLALGNKARENLMVGIDALANAVRATIGPKGRNVALNQKYNPPEITNSGSKISGDMEVSNLYHNLGIQLLKQAAKQTAEIAGDGTSTATILAHAIIREGQKNIAAGANPMRLKRGIERAVRAASEEILGMARKIQGAEDIRLVATASSGSKIIGDAIAEAMKRVGAEGLIMVYRSQKAEPVRVEYVEGMKYDRGWFSQYFVTDERQKYIELEEPYILLSDKDIYDPMELVPILDKMVQIGKKDILVMVPDLKEGALSLLITNNLNGVIRCAAVRPPEYGEIRKDVLQDLAILTGGMVISDELGHKMSSVTISDLGQARTVRVDKENTAIIGGKGDAELIKARIAELRHEITMTEEDHKREKLEKRIAWLSEAVAIMWVGGATEAERDERISQVEDALSCMRAAAEEGILPGGGLALANAALSLGYLEAEGDEAVGIGVVRRALQEPLRQIVENAGQDGDAVLANIRRLQKEEDNEYIGFDVMAEEYGDMFEGGVLDPARVVRTALHNGASCATMILTTEAIITDLPVMKRDPIPTVRGQELPEEPVRRPLSRRY